MKHSPYFRRLIVAACLILTYFAAGRLGLKLAILNASASPVWPPTGIALAALLILGSRMWPAVFVGAFLVNITTAGNVATSLGLATGNTLEGLAGAWLITRFAGGLDVFDHARDVFRFAVFALIATTVSATIGVVSLALGGLAAWETFGPVWLTWWLGDVGGALVVAPALITWSTRPSPGWNRLQLMELAGLLIGLIIAGQAVFGGWLSINARTYPLLFLSVPMLIWIGFRFAQRETATAVLILSSIAVWGTIHGVGPFPMATRNESLVLLQMFLGFLAVMSMAVTAGMSEHRASEQRLETQQATTKTLAECASLADAIPRILQIVCEKLRWDMGLFWRVNASGGWIECTESWIASPISGQVADFLEESKRQRFQSGIGMPGRAWKRRDVAWIDDVVADPNFPRAPFAAKAKLRSAFAFPVMLDHTVFGVVEFFTRDLRRIDKDLLATMASVGSQIGQFIKRGRAEGHFRLAVESAPGAIVIVNQAGEIVLANSRVSDIFGYRWEELLGWNFETLFTKSARDRLASFRSEFSSNADPQLTFGPSELDATRKNGSEFPAEVGLHPVETDEGWLVLGTIFDITERKRSEEALAKLAVIVESSNDAIYSKTLEGVITSWNKAAEGLYGYAAEELVGKDVRLLVPEERTAEEKEILTRIGRGEGVASLETVRLRKDGVRVDVSLTVSPLKSSDGGITGASAIARDITERKRATAELMREKAAAEAANQAKDHFLAMLSHELRTPLTPVISAVDALDATLAGVPEAASALAMIRRNVELEARLIDDLLDLTSIVKGKLHLRREPLDAHRCIHDALDLCRTGIKAKRIAVATELDAPGHFVSADPTRLQQVFWNIIKNAIKFSNEGGSIVISSRNDSTDGIVITIRDDGVGIDAEVLPRIFDSFEQGEQTTHRRYGGLGLGLAISKALVEAQGGTLAAASEGRDRGAAFSVRLEISQAIEASRPSPVADFETAPPGLRILLVEDHNDTRIALAKLLCRQGYKVETAEDVASALNVAAHQEFDLLVSDIGLPDASGLDLMQELRRKRPIKGIALSGFGMESDATMSKASGFSEHLLKPVNFQELQAAIRRICSKGRDPTPPVHPGSSLPRS